MKKSPSPVSSSKCHGKQDGPQKISPKLTPGEK